ncbi:MAG: protein translocase subunit SecF, partial [bacterium]
GVIVRMPVIDDAARADLLRAIAAKYPGAEELRYDSVGPSIGKELKSKAWSAIIATQILVMLYIAWAFRKVAGRIQAWKYGLLVIIAGLHDAIIPVGFFAILGHFYGTEVGGAFIAAILTILGYSINDTIVVFDRIRENILRTEGTVAQVVTRSLNQVITRSINTTLTTLLALSAVYLLGGASTKDFALALIVGIASGAYSSIFLASPLLVTWQKKSSAR